MKIKIQYFQNGNAHADIIESELAHTAGFGKQLEKAYSGLGVEVFAIHRISELETTLD